VTGVVEVAEGDLNEAQRRRQPRVNRPRRTSNWRECRVRPPRPRWPWMSLPGHAFQALQAM